MLGRHSCIIVSGGFRINNDVGIKFPTVEVLAGDLGTKKLPNLPEDICSSSMVEHNGKILLCGGQNNLKNCLQLHHGTWEKHSTLHEERALHSVVKTKQATFLFGGFYKAFTYEYLPKDSNTWFMGKSRIPGGFFNGCAIAVELQNEILLIGGTRTEKRILSFNVNDHTFRELPFHLNVGRDRHSCAFIPNTKKIIVTGGYKSTSNFLNSTEIIDTENGIVTMTECPMNSARFGHGTGAVTINGKERLTVFGGRQDWFTWVDSVELYNDKTEKWEVSSMRLNEPKGSFGFLAVKLSDIVSTV